MWFTNNIKKIVWLLCLVFLGAFSQEKMSLKQAIQKLSEAHQIQFSYSEKQIQQQGLVAYQKTKELNATLTHLSLQTGLVFEKIDTQNYIIRKKSNKKKSVCGVVYDAKTGDKIPFVNGYSQNRQFYTNSAGAFDVQHLLQDDFITFSALGYASKTLPVVRFSSSCKDIFLTQEIQQLSEISITDYITQGISKKNNGSIVVNSKKTGVLPGVIEPDILQTVQLIPGVQSPDETASGIYIRGSTPDQNLVIFDGMKMYHSSHFFGLTSTFNPYITNQVKLYRSGTHAKYGNNVGGVLDIDIDNSISKKTTLGFGSTFTHSDFFIKTPFLNAKTGLVFSARRSITDFFNSITYQKFSETVFQNSRIEEGMSSENLRITNASNTYFYEDYHTKIMYHPSDKSKFSFSYLYNNNDLNFKGENLRFSEFFNDKIIIKNKGFHIDWSYGTPKKGIHNIAFFNTFFDKNYEGLKTNDDSNTTFLKSNHLTETAVSYLFEKQTIHKNKWQLGYQYTHNKVNYLFKRVTAIDENELNDGIQKTGQNQAVFSEYQYKPTNKWLFNIGLRGQHFIDIQKAFLEPRLFLNYKASRLFRFKFSTELKHQSISQVTDFRTDGLGGLFNRFWNLSNNDQFPVLKSNQTSAGFVFRQNGWSVDAELYHKHIKGILYLIDENIKAQKYFNGNNTVLGLDVLIKKQWQHYNTWLSYSLSKNQYQFSGLNQSNLFDGAYDAPHNLIWSHNYKYRSLEFSLGWRFRSGIPYTAKKAVLNKKTKRLSVSFDDLNTQRLPNYQRLDFSAQYRFNIYPKKNIKAKIGLTFQNLTNKQNILFRDYEVKTVTTGVGVNRKQEEKLIEENRISLGFVPNMVFRLNF